MKHLCLLLVFISACTSSRTQFAQNSITEQIFIQHVPEDSLPGKCYARSKQGDAIRWIEVICQNQITKQFIAQLQNDLVRHGYTIESEEIEKKNTGPSTVASLIQFQKDQNLAYGNLDWATVNRLKQQP